jgi:hypothetical protein
MIIEPVIDWIVLLPAEMKVVLTAALLILIFAYTSLRRATRRNNRQAGAITPFFLRAARSN